MLNVSESGLKIWNYMTVTSGKLEKPDNRKQTTTVLAALVQAKLT